MWLLEVDEHRFATPTGPDELARAFAALAAPTLVVWVHGGLVSRDDAVAAAESLAPDLEAAGAAPLFVAWRSSIGETLRKDLDDVVRSRLFPRLLRLAERALDRRALRTRLSAAAERDAVEADIRADDELEPLLRAARLDRGPARALPLGADWVARLAGTVLQVVLAVVERLATEPGRPRGATVVEEILRGLYVGLVAGEVWDQMKRDTAEACAPGAPVDALLDHLATWWTDDPARRVVLVGHSAGAVLLCHLLRRAAAKGLPAGAGFDVVWLAAAASFELLSDTLRAPGVPERIARMRTFGLSDARERGYSELPLYPASLLYLVSGLLEARPDLPLVGMERYWDPIAYPDLGSVHLELVRRWFAASRGRAVWAPAGPEPGASTDASRHGGFADDRDTRASVTHLLAHADWSARTRGAGTSVPDAWRTNARSRRIQRRAAAPGAATGAFRAAVSQVDLTPELYRSTAGYGATQARRGRGWYGRLRATLALLEDRDGGRVLLVATDLHVGSRFLAEYLGRELAGIGVGVDRVVLGATHTHCGPGGLYGAPFYDLMAGELVTGLFDGFDTEGTLALGDVMVDAARALPARLEPARVGYGEVKSWGNLWNRSLVAFLANDLEPRSVVGQLPRHVDAWAVAQWGTTPGDIAALEARHPGRGAVDPRLRVMWIGGDAGPLGAFGWLPATPTLVPFGAALFSSDVAGAIAREVARAHGLQFGVLGSALGDTNPLPRDASLARVRAERDSDGRTRDEQRRAACELVRRTARELARDYGRALEQARDAAVEPSGLVVRFAEVVAPGARTDTAPAPAHLGPVPPTDIVADTWLPGQSTTVASELNRDPDKPGRERSDVVTGDYLQPVDWSRPHDPKSDRAEVNLGPAALEVHLSLLRAVSGLGRIGFDPWAPLRVVSVGDLHLVGVPAEPSVRWSLELEASLAGLGGQRLVTANCGGYLGYVGTLAEYVVQDYEGSSVYWGRAFPALVRSRVLALAAAGATAPPQGDAWFVRTDVAIVDEEPDETRGIRSRPYFARVEAVSGLADPDDALFFGEFRPHRRPRKRADGARGWPLPGERALVSLEVRDPGGAWTPAGWDDRDGEIGLWFEDGRWRIFAQVPHARVDGRDVRFVVHEPDMRPDDPGDPALVARG